MSWHISFAVANDFDMFDNDAEGTTDAEYFAFVAWFSALTADELRLAQGNSTMQRQALCRYYKRGERANLTPGELIDFLGVSSSSILDKAGYNEEEQDALMQISDSLTEEDIADASLPEDESSAQQFAMDI